MTKKRPARAAPEPVQSRPGAVLMYPLLVDLDAIYPPPYLHLAPAPVNIGWVRVDLIAVDPPWWKPGEVRELRITNLVDLEGRAWR